jgi:phosphate uptake regulator
VEQGDNGLVTELDLTGAELEVLRAIHSNPTGSQRTLADSPGLSAATISKRAANADGLEWEHQESFVKELFVYHPGLLNNCDNGQTNSSIDFIVEIDRISDDLTTIAEEVDRLKVDREAIGCLEDLEWAQRLYTRACNPRSSPVVDVIKSILH